MFCDLLGEPGGRGYGHGSAAGGICWQEYVPRGREAGSYHDGRLALSVSGGALDSADILFHRNAGNSDCDWAVCADWRRSADGSFAVFLHNGRGISFAGDASDQPVGAVLRDGLAGEWDCDFGVADRIVDR